MTYWIDFKLEGKEREIVIEKILINTWVKSVLNSKLSTVLTKTTAYIY